MKIIAVSYTHLDVYKRQILFIPNKTAAALELPPAIPAATGMCLFKTILTPPGSLNSSISMAAVSYTHLDVYKRQLFAILMESPIPSALMMM